VSRGKTSLPALVRWLHTYVSLLGFATILFFALTGLTLNHAAWFESGGEAERWTELECPRAIVGAAGETDEARVAGWLRSSAGARGDVYDFAADAERVSIVLKAPGYAADAEIDVASGQARVHVLELNGWAVLDDLHKGRDSGVAWAWVIDVSAVLMAVSAVSGLWLVLYVRRRRSPGLVVTLVGTLVLLAVVWLWVP
jgi:hypothetical protein